MVRCHAMMHANCQLASHMHTWALARPHRIMDAARRMHDAPPLPAKMHARHQQSSPRPIITPATTTSHPPLAPYLGILHIHSASSRVFLTRKKLLVPCSYRTFPPKRRDQGCQAGPTQGPHCYQATTHVLESIGQSQPSRLQGSHDQPALGWWPQLLLPSHSCWYNKDAQPNHRMRQIHATRQHTHTHNTWRS